MWEFFGAEFRGAYKEILSLKGGELSIMNISVSKKVFNEVYLPSLLSYETRYEVYYGG